MCIEGHGSDGALFFLLRGAPLALEGGGRGVGLERGLGEEQAGNEDARGHEEAEADGQQDGVPQDGRVVDTAAANGGVTGEKVDEGVTPAGEGMDGQKRWTVEADSEGWRGHENGSVVDATATETRLMEA